LNETFCNHRELEYIRVLIHVKTAQFISTKRYESDERIILDDIHYNLFQVDGRRELLKTRTLITSSILRGQDVLATIHWDLKTKLYNL